MITYLHCPTCDNIDVLDKGDLPAFPLQIFGGIPVATKLSAGRLYWCQKCDLHFRYPYPNQDILTSLYEKLPASVWQCEKGRPVWHEVARLLENYSANNTILDVGCFRGDFLNQLDTRYRKLGIEPNFTARKVAASGGVELVGHTIDDVQTVATSVGVITLLDVIEHIHRPLRALECLKRFLAPHGSIIVLTGATDTLAWRLFGRHYWYSALPEHVTFFSLRWFLWAADKLDMHVVWHRYLASEPSSSKRLLAQFTRLFLYTMIQQLRTLGIPESILFSLPLIRRIARWKHVPWWKEATDHILVVLTS